MHFEFVEPSKRNADIIIPENGNHDIGIEFICSKIREEIKAKPADEEIFV
jgi:uridine kinase